MAHRPPRPAMLAVVGDAGAGKRTLIRGIRQLLGEDRCVSVALDDYVALDRETRRRAGLTAVHPEALHLGLMAQHLRLLRQGETVFKPVYDHASGRFGSPEFLCPSPIIVAHGIHGLFSPELRALWDVSIYCDPAPELRSAWKLQRDRSARGYSATAAADALRALDADSAQFVAPQRARADLVMRVQPPRRSADGSAALDIHLEIARPVPLPALEALLSEPASRHALRLHSAAGGADHVEIHGGVDDVTAATLEERMLLQLSGTPPRRQLALGQLDERAGTRSHALALAQLIVAHYVIEKGAIAVPEIRRAASA